MKLPNNVEKIWKDSDGWWAILKEGWIIDSCSGIREDTKKKLLNRVKEAVFTLDK